MKTISGIEAHCAFDKEVDVEDEQLYAGVNGGRQVKAGEVLAVPPKCAVRLFVSSQLPMAYSSLDECSFTHCHLRSPVDICFRTQTPV